MAEGTGFEPAKGFEPLNGLAILGKGPAASLLISQRGGKSSFSRQRDTLRPWPSVSILSRPVAIPVAIAAAIRRGLSTGRPSRAYRPAPGADVSNFQTTRAAENRRSLPTTSDPGAISVPCGVVPACYLVPPSALIYRFDCLFCGSSPF